MTDRRFIEESFPVKEVSVESAREKNIRHGHISTLHIWWARRPLASSRATNYAALIPAPKSDEEWNRKRNFIIELSKWENSSNQTLLRKAREDILKANGGKPPKVLDPFGGGGSIPLEALRLGCETYSNDLNPVAVLIQKCTLEYPQKYGKPRKKKEDLGLFSETSYENPLVEDVKKWGNWVLEEAKKEIGKFYPEEKDGSIPVGYIWARTIPCQNPTCEAEIPLMRQFWLAKKPKKKVTLYPYVENGKVEFRIVGDGYAQMPAGFDPTQGTVARAVATCLICGATMAANTTRRLFREGNAGERMVAVVLYKPGIKGKRYRIAGEKDLSVFQAAEEYLEKKREQLELEWGMDPVPDEPLPLMSGVFNVPIYGIDNWGSLFNSRQKLSLITFAEKIRESFKMIIAENCDRDYAKAIVSYLGLILSRHSSYNATLCWWEPLGERSFNVFGRQALPMVFDYSEQNPFSILTGNWGLQTKICSEIIEQISSIQNNCTLIITQLSATNLNYKDNYFDAIFTDPPYYFNVPYADLSDFFYVWLKRAVGQLHPELFSTPLSPKSNEIVQMKHWDSARYPEKGKEWFEEMLTNSFQEIYRILKPDGVAIIVYTHKSTAGWETLINSLLDSGLIITGGWPLHTEMATRLRASKSAALSSSIYIIARKIKCQPTGFYNDVKEELKKHLNKKLERLWNEGIVGADFFIAAIGSAIEVFGKYEQVMDYEGNVIRADRLLEEVRKITTDYAVHQILHNGFAGEIEPLTRFYVLWRWEFGAPKVLFDDARKLATSCGIDLAQEWNRKGFIKKEREFIRVLGPQERDMDDLKNSTGLIDVLHGVLLFWEKSRHDDMVNLLQESGFGKSESFYRVAQAISETLPLDSKEKQLLDGFLAGRERIREEVAGGPRQRRLL